MKRYLSLILVLIILSTSTTAFAQIEGKLENHWSKDLIEKEFVAYYFPYLAKNNFTKFDPDEKINNKDFSLSLGSLLKDYDLGSISNNIVSTRSLTREEVVNIIGRELMDVDDLKGKSKKISFKDINTMEEESIELLRLLFNLEIIYGVSEDEFAPDNLISQGEAIIVLQRVKGVLDTMKELSFTTKGVIQSHNSQEDIIVKRRDNKVLVTITKEFGTPGYGLSVDKIVRDDGKKQYKVFLDITPPDEGVILPQVITYKTITIEIEKNQLKGKESYDFIVEDIKANLSR